MKYVTVTYSDPVHSLFSRSDCDGVINDYHTALEKINPKNKPDLVVFHGGADVSPFLYGEQVKGAHTTPVPSSRDVLEMFVWNRCARLDIPMFGICRGMQLFAVMNGDSLWQHVVQHPGQHDITFTDGATISVPSVHHQMVRLSKYSRGHIVATSNEDVVAHNEYGKEEHIKEIEAIFYPHTLCFGVQTHPEYVSYSDPLAIACRESLNDYFGFSLGRKS
jgi:gamma-glutamyl-gamma-aminobutyrate hydrolase PuuD